MIKVEMMVTEGYVFCEKGKKKRARYTDLHPKIMGAYTVHGACFTYDYLFLSGTSLHENYRELVTHWIFPLGNYILRWLDMEQPRRTSEREILATQHRVVGQVPQVGVDENTEEACLGSNLPLVSVVTLGKAPLTPHFSGSRIESIGLR